MMRILIAALLLAGCASARPTYTADGGQGHVLDCSGTARNWGMCFEKAGEICAARGYDILERSTDQSAFAAGGQGGFTGAVSNSRSMVIRCK